MKWKGIQRRKTPRPKALWTQFAKPVPGLPPTNTAAAMTADLQAGGTRKRLARKVWLRHGKPKTTKLRLWGRPLKREEIRVSRKPLKRTRLKPVSALRRLRMKSYRADADAFLRENPKCACCHPRAVLLREFWKPRPATDIHHSRGRVGRLLFMQEHWRGVCRPCHDWIGANPNLAREIAMLCAPGLWNTP